jgi:hypothetical protein
MNQIQDPELRKKWFTRVVNDRAKGYRILDEAGIRAMPTHNLKRYYRKVSDTLYCINEATRDPDNRCDHYAPNILQRVEGLDPETVAKLNTLHFLVGKCKEVIRERAEAARAERRQRAFAAGHWSSHLVPKVPVVPKTGKRKNRDK